MIEETPVEKGFPHQVPSKRREVQHDETPSQIVDHKFSPMGEWWTRCRHCKLAEAAHAESELSYYGDDNPEG